MTGTDGIELAQGCISIGLIKSTVMIGIHHVAFRHIHEETDLESMGIQFVGIFLAYLGYHIHNTARACSSGKTCTHMEGDVVVVGSMLKSHHSCLKYIVEVVLAVLVGQVVGYKHTS